MSRLASIKTLSAMAGNNRSLKTVTPVGVTVYRQASNLLQNDWKQDKVISTVQIMLDWHAAEKPINLVSDKDRAVLAQSLVGLDSAESKSLRRLQKKASKRLKHAERQADVTTKMTKRMRVTVADMMSEDKWGTVDALSSMATFVSFLEPDHMVSFLEQSTGLGQVWKPAVSSIPAYVAVAAVFDEISDTKIRLNLIETYYRAAHECRWWDATTGVETIKGKKIRSPYERNPVNKGRKITSSKLLKDILSGDSTYTVSSAETASKMALSETDLVRIHNLSNQGLVRVDSDLLIAHMDINPMYKPQSPMGGMGSILVHKLGKLKDLSYLKHSREWIDAYPYQSIDGFNLPLDLIERDRTTIGNYSFTLIENKADLQTNANMMGNCTYGSYLTELKKGETSLWRISNGKDKWNALTSKGHKSLRLIEGSKKHDRTPVTDEVRNTFEQLLKKGT